MGLDDLRISGLNSGKIEKLFYIYHFNKNDGSC